MNLTTVILMAAQVASGAQVTGAQGPVAVKATASVEILAASRVSFEDWDALAKQRPETVSTRTDQNGTRWLEFS